MILVETAAGHMKKGEVTAAVGELQEPVTLSPDFTEARYQLGLPLLQSADGSTKRRSANDGATKAETAFQRVTAESQ
jgi:hypothetical protein